MKSYKTSRLDGILIESILVIQNREFNKKFNALKNIREGERMHGRDCSCFCLLLWSNSWIEWHKICNPEYCFTNFWEIKNRINAVQDDKSLTRVLKKILLYWTNFYLQKYKIYEKKLIIIINKKSIYYL